MDKCDYLVVGLGFAGAVLAERLAAAGKKVIAIDQRDHLGGNSFDQPGADGILVHQYGPHIFHTNSRVVWEYLARFTDWQPYEHRVKAQVAGRLVTLPVNLNTVDELFDHREANEITSALIGRFGAGQRVPILELRRATEPLIRQLADRVYDQLFLHYTVKQWGMTPEEISPQVTARVPVWTDRDDRYFRDAFQGMPAAGYGELFRRLLDRPNLEVRLKTPFKAVKEKVSWKKLIYTGPIDEFFSYCFGRLPYRSLEFKPETVNQEFFQPVAVVNYPGPEPFTRITEFKRLTGQKAPRTVITREYPKAFTGEGDIPYYPVPLKENHDRFFQYEEIAAKQPEVHFLGRLGQYRYINMDEAVAQSLQLSLDIY